VTAVLDASAVLAFLNGEPGGDVAARHLGDARISAVNAIEVGTKLMDGGMTFAAAWEAIDLLDMELVGLDAAMAAVATQLREPTKAGGLSLADRACLALAIRYGTVAITADRAWATLDLPCPVELIR
jgi:PIN domain nuclease of toxin-antitoxin system